MLIILYKNGIIFSSVNEPAKVRDSTMEEIKMNNDQKDSQFNLSTL
jgi:hypothetical protein